MFYGQPSARILQCSISHAAHTPPPRVCIIDDDNEIFANPENANDKSNQSDCNDED